MDPDQVAALSLVGLDGLSLQGGCSRVGDPQGTLESRIARGRIALGRMLETSVEPFDERQNAQHTTVGRVNGTVAKETAP